MSEDRTLTIFAESRKLSMDEDREQEIFRERRVFDVRDEDRTLEVLP